MARPKKLTMDFFIHDATASADRKIRLVSKKHGNDGYATYFRLLEALCQEQGIKLSLADTETGELLAEDFHLRDVQHLYKIIQYCADINLFDKQLWGSERVVFSSWLFEQYNESNPYGRLPAHEWKRVRSTVFERDNYTCQYCGATDRPLHCDHVMPISRGGSNEMSNLRTACCDCNRRKNNKTVQEWLGGGL